KGRTDDAIAEYKEAIRLNKHHAEAYYNLGNLFLRQGPLQDAMEAYRGALRIKPDYPKARCNLGRVLQRQGECHQALQELRRGDELGSKDPSWPFPSAQWVRECERLVELDKRLPSFLAGIDTPASPSERIELAELCNLKHLNRAAVRFYSE